MIASFDGTAYGTISVGDVYTAGVNSGYSNGKTDGANSLELYAGGYSGVADLSYGESVSILASTTRGDGTTKVESILVKAPADRYNAGVESVTVPNASIVRQAADYYAGGTDHSTTVYIRATASNGSYGTQSFSVSGASAYNAGKNDGANSLSISPASNIGLGYSGSQTVTATTTKADGTNVTKSVTITAPADRYNTGYNAGKTDGVNSVTAFSPEVVSSSQAHSTSKLMAITIRSKASNGATKDLSTSIDASAVYDYGYSAGFAAAEAQYTAVSAVVDSTYWGYGTLYTIGANNTPQSQGTRYWRYGGSSGTYYKKTTS